MDSNLTKLITQRKKKEKQRPKRLPKEERTKNMIKWVTFYRRNINLYVEHRLQVRLHPFQHIMLYLMGVSEVFFAICSRGLSKKNKVSI